MQDCVVPASKTYLAVEVLDVAPFIMSTEISDQDDNRDLPAGLCVPYLFGQQSGARPRAVDESVPTIATRGAISLYAPSPFILPQNGYHGACTVTRPMTRLSARYIRSL